MKALFAGGGEAPQLLDIAVPKMTGGIDAIVRPLAVALCDLDLPLIFNHLPSKVPFALGHEFVAEVIEVGRDVKDWHPGDRVIVPFQISCGGCPRCSARRSLDCLSLPPLSTYGLKPFGGGDWGGAVAELVNVPYADAMLVGLPNGAKPIEYASVSDNVVDGYRCVAPHCTSGDKLLIIGSASVGLYAAATAAALAVDCVYVDSDAARLAIAEGLGAKVVDAVPNGQSFGEFDVTASCISSDGGLRSALASTVPGGICQSAGIHFQPVELPLLEMYRRGVHFHTGRANARDDIPAVVDLIVSGALNVAAVTGAVIPLDDAVSALQQALPAKTVINMETG